MSKPGNQLRLVNTIGDDDELIGNFDGQPGRIKGGDLKDQLPPGGGAEDASDLAVDPIAGIESFTDAQSLLEFLRGTDVALSGNIAAVAASIAAAVADIATLDDAVDALEAAAGDVDAAIAAKLNTSALDTDATLAADSDLRVATQKAVKAAIAAAIAGVGSGIVPKGVTDASANPNYPAATKGDQYYVVVAGKVGGGSGATVAVGDFYYATANNAGGTQASVGANWSIVPLSSAGYALKAVAQTFSQPQAVKKLTEKYLFEIENDNTAPAGPRMRTIRRTAAAGDGLGGLEAWAQDHASADFAYAALVAEIAAKTGSALSEVGGWTVQAAIAGVLTSVWKLRDGIYAVGLANPGGGKINVNEVQVAGTAYPTPAALAASIAAKIAATALSTDGTLAANSDALLPSQKAVKTAIATAAAAVQKYPLFSSVPATTVVGDVIDILDRDNAGDEGGGLAYRTGSGGADAVPAGIVNKVTDAAGKNFYIISRTIKLNTVGKTPHTEITAQLGELIAKGGGRLIVDDTHLCAGRVEQLTIPDDIEIEIEGRHNDPTFKCTNAAAFTNHNFISLYQANLNEGRLSASHMTLDVSAGTGTSAISMHLQNRARLYDFWVVGGTAYLDGHGDTGVGHIGVRDFLWDGGGASYFSDSGAYLGGDNTPNDSPDIDDGVLTKLTNLFMEGNNNGIAFKREVLRAAVDNCDIIKGTNGITTAEAGTAPDQARSARELYVTDCLINKMTNYPINVRGDTKPFISDNVIRDFGRNLDGTGHGTAGLAWAAIRLQGPSYGHMEGNLIELVEWARGAGLNPGGVTVGLRLEQLVMTAVSTRTYTPTGNVARGNTYRRLDRGINENLTGPNRYLGETMGDYSGAVGGASVGFSPRDTKVIAPVFAAGFNSGSIAEWDLENGGKVRRVGAVETVLM